MHEPRSDRPESVHDVPTPAPEGSIDPLAQARPDDGPALPDSTPAPDPAVSPNSPPAPVERKYEPRLPAAQERALQNLTAGRSISEAARIAGVDRRTLHRWIRDDARFAAAYNAWRQEVIDSGRARVLAMANRALDTMNAAIENGDARVALQVAKATGALDAQKRGLTDADTIRRKRKLRDGRREIKLAAAEVQYRRDLGEHPRAWLKHLDKVEENIDLLLKLRRSLLEDEKPEDRAKRVAEITERGWKFEATADVFALADTQCPARPRFRAALAPEAPASLPPPATAGPGPLANDPRTLDAAAASSEPTPPPSDPPHPQAEPAAFELPPLAAPTPPNLAPTSAPRLTKALVTRARSRPYDPDASDPSDKFFGYEPR